MLDEYVIDSLKKFTWLKEPVETLNGIYNFFVDLNKKIENNDIKAKFIGMCLFDFVSKEEIRDSNMAAENFEKILGNILCGDVLGEKNRPIVTITLDVIDLLKEYSEGQQEQAYSDLEENKRKKADIKCGKLILSAKTLKGPLFDINLIITDKYHRYELNIGSFSYYALLVGLLDDEEIKNLGERKGALGSKKKLIKSIYTRLKDKNKWDEFVERFERFGNYIFGDIDFVVGFKSGYKMKLRFFHGKDFIDKWVEVLKTDYKKFFAILNRWENGNPRVLYTSLFRALKKEKKLNEVELHFDQVMKNEQVKAFKENMREIIKEEIFKKFK